MWNIESVVRSFPEERDFRLGAGFGILILQIYYNIELQVGFRVGLGAGFGILILQIYYNIELQVGFRVVRSRVWYPHPSDMLQHWTPGRVQSRVRSRDRYPQSSDILQNWILGRVQSRVRSRVRYPRSSDILQHWTPAVGFRVGWGAGFNILILQQYYNINLQEGLEYILQRNSLKTFEFVARTQFPFCFRIW